MISPEEREKYRWQFAGQLFANPECSIEAAVIGADALIAELEKSAPKGCEPKESMQSKLGLEDFAP